jgi:hypothetical protein
MGAKSFGQVKTSSLLHDVLTCEIITALAEYLLKTFGDTVAKHGCGIVEVAFGVPLRHNCSPLARGSIILRLGVRSPSGRLLLLPLSTHRLSTSRSVFRS